jgi:hypothetical protein
MTSSLIRAAPRSGGIEGMGGRAKLSLALRLALCALLSGARFVLYHDDILLCQCRANAAPKARHSPASCDFATLLSRSPLFCINRDRGRGLARDGDDGGVQCAPRDGGDDDVLP